MGTEFSANPLISVAGLAVLPVFIWFLKQDLTRNIFFFGSFLLVLFTIGTFEAVGINNSVLRIVTEIYILLVFIKGVLINKKKIVQTFPGLIWLLLFIVSAVLSAVLNNMSFVIVLLFFRDYLMVFLFFYGVVNISLSSYEYKILKTLVIYLFISQIGASIIKFLIVQDIIEPYIGTMAILGGSLTVLFSLFGSAYAIGNYLVSMNRRHLFWVFAFILFSLLGGKRATIVYFPILFFLLLYVYQIRFETLKLRGVQRIVLFLTMSVILLYVSLRIMPSLNKENAVWGSFDLEYALDYSERYITTGAGAVETIGRSEAPSYIFNMLYDDNASNFLLGYGTGHLVKSSFNEAQIKSGSQQDLSESLYGVGYSSRTTFLQLLLQMGLLGVLLYLILINSLYRFCRKSFKSRSFNYEFKSEYLLMVSLFSIFLLDFFTYSVTFSQVSAPSIVMFLFLGQLNKVKL